MVQKITLAKDDSVELTVESLEAHPAVITYDEAYGFALTKMNNEWSAGQRKKQEEAAEKAQEEFRAKEASKNVYGDAPANPSTQPTPATPAAA